MLARTIARHCSRRRAPQLFLLPTRRGFAKGSPTSVVLNETCLQDPASHFGVQATSGRHTLHADLMPEAGGQDIGPSPKEYAMVALGSCTLMTMRIYANAMIDGGKWPNRHIKKMGVKVEEYGAEGHLPLGIRVHVEMESNLDDEQKQRLLTAAGKCPVKRMFGGGMKEGITTVWAGEVEKRAQ